MFGLEEFLFESQLCGILGFLHILKVSIHEAHNVQSKMVESADGGES